jgi:hypothetical protein
MAGPLVDVVHRFTKIVSLPRQSFPHAGVEASFQAGKDGVLDDVFVPGGGPHQLTGQIRPFGEVIGKVKAVQDAVDTGLIVQEGV